MPSDPSIPDNENRENLPLNSTETAENEEGYTIRLKEPEEMWWEHMREYLKERYFPFVLFFDISDDKTAYSSLSPPIQTRKANTGWTVYDGKDYVLIVGGEAAFAEYGYRKMFIDTVNEVCDQEITAKNWVTTIGEGVTEWMSSVAWVLMNQHPQVDTTAFPITELADQILAQCKTFEEIIPGITEHVNQPTLE